MSHPSLRYRAREEDARNTERRIKGSSDEESRDQATKNQRSSLPSRSNPNKLPNQKWARRENKDGLPGAKAKRNGLQRPGPKMSKKTRAGQKNRWPSYLAHASPSASRRGLSSLAIRRGDHGGVPRHQGGPLKHGSDGRDHIRRRRRASCEERAGGDAWAEKTRVKLQAAAKHAPRVVFDAAKPGGTPQGPLRPQRRLGASGRAQRAIDAGQGTSRELPKAP